jgi:hypothetical protein
MASLKWERRILFWLVSGTVESRLSDLRLSDIPFYPTFRVGAEKAERMSHCEGLNSTQTALVTVNSKIRRPLQTYCILFGRWRDVAVMKMKVAEKRILITDLLKNKLFHLQLFYYVKYCFWFRDRLVDAVLYFVLSLIISIIDLIYPRLLIILLYYPTFSIIRPLFRFVQVG